MRNPNELTLIKAIQGLKDRDFTSIDLTNACFNQIEKHDQKINAFLLIRKEEALQEAKSADDAILKHGPLIFKEKPLLGIPYACKDNFSTKGIETTAASNILKGYIPPYESTVTQRLKSAGAVLLGKTNMDAFAHGSSTETSDFFTTKNPWNYERVPGGSSGGSAAATTANMCIFSIGSETAGSVRGPAVWCGITGLKPTYGRVSRYGVIAMASSTDSPGPLTKTVEDAALILSIIAGGDLNDATASPEPIDDYLSEMSKADLKGLRVGKPNSYFEIEMENGVSNAVNEAIEELKGLGVEIVEMDLLDPKYSIAVYTILQRSEVSSNLARFDGIRYGHPRTAFGFEAKKRMMLGSYVLSAGYYDQYYAKAQKIRTLIVEDFKSAFEKVDLVLGPTMPFIAPKIGMGKNSAMFGELIDKLQEPSSIAGLSAITVPCGLSESMPVGFQLIGPFFSESRILGVAHAYQKNTDFHNQFPNLEGY